LWDIRGTTRDSDNIVPFFSEIGHSDHVWKVSFLPLQPHTALSLSEDGTLVSWNFWDGSASLLQGDFSSLFSNNNQVQFGPVLPPNDLPFSDMDFWDNFIALSTEGESIVFCEFVLEMRQ